MRLWHKDLIPYLPKGQLLSQWRELNSIFVKEDNHILINYIYGYEGKEHLAQYTKLILQEYKNRGYKVYKWVNFNNFFDTFAISVDGGINELETILGDTELSYKEHNDEYLLICFFNLFEKFIRGQKDFSQESYNAMANLMKSKKLI